MLKWEEVEKRKKVRDMYMDTNSGWRVRSYGYWYCLWNEEPRSYDLSFPQGLMLSARLPSARLSCQGERVRGLRHGAWVFRLWALIRARYSGDKSDEHPFEAMRFTNVPGFFWSHKMWCFLGFWPQQVGIWSDKHGDATKVGMPHGWMTGPLVDSWEVNWGIVGQVPLFFNLR